MYKRRLLIGSYGKLKGNNFLNAGKSNFWNINISFN